MNTHLQEFAAHVRHASCDAFSEAVVRRMLENVAKDCPMGVLVKLGQCLVECARTEIGREAERN